MYESNFYPVRRHSQYDQYRFSSGNDDNKYFPKSLIHMNTLSGTAYLEQESQEKMYKNKSSLLPVSPFQHRGRIQTLVHNGGASCSSSSFYQNNSNYGGDNRSTSAIAAGFPSRFFGITDSSSYSFTSNQTAAFNRLSQATSYNSNPFNQKYLLSSKNQELESLVQSSINKCQLDENNNKKYQKFTNQKDFDDDEKSRKIRRKSQYVHHDDDSNHGRIKNPFINGSSERHYSYNSQHNDTNSLNNNQAVASQKQFDSFGKGKEKIDDYGQITSSVTTKINNFNNSYNQINDNNNNNHHNHHHYQKKNEQNQYESIAGFKTIQQIISSTGYKNVVNNENSMYNTDNINSIQNINGRGVMQSHIYIRNDDDVQSTANNYQYRPQKRRTSIYKSKQTIREQDNSGRYNNGEDPTQLYKKKSKHRIADRGYFKDQEEDQEQDNPRFSPPSQKYGTGSIIQGVLNIKSSNADGSVARQSNRRPDSPRRSAYINSDSEENSRASGTFRIPDVIIDQLNRKQKRQMSSQSMQLMGVSTGKESHSNSKYFAKENANRQNKSNNVTKTSLAHIHQQQTVRFNIPSKSQSKANATGNTNIENIDVCPYQNSRGFSPDRISVRGKSFEKLRL